MTTRDDASREAATRMSVRGPSLTITDTGCADCNRREIALHTAQIELQHRDVVIAAMQQQIELLKQRVERGKK